MRLALEGFGGRSRRRLFVEAREGEIGEVLNGTLLEFIHFWEEGVEEVEDAEVFLFGIE